MGFLKNLSDTEKTAAIQALGDERRQQLIRGTYHGANVAGMDLDEAMHLTGADFTVRKETIQTTSGELIGSHVAGVNASTGKPLSVVGAGFGFVDHSQAIAPIRPILDRGDAYLQAIDMRDEGARFEAYATLGFSQVERAGLDRADALCHTLRVSNAHDGSSQLTLGVSIRRLICDNGMGFNELAVQERTRHSSKVQERMPDFGSSVLEALTAAESATETFQALADSAMASAEFVEFANALLIAERGEVKTERGERRRESDLTDLLGLFESGAGNLGQDRYDALNAVTEWLTPRREAYADASKYARAYYTNETGTRARTRSRALRMLTA